MVSIKSYDSKYYLYVDDDLLQTFNFPIEQVCDGSSNIKVMVSAEEFVIFNVCINSFMYGNTIDTARKFIQVISCSPKYKSFGAKYFNNDLKKHLYNIISDDGFHLNVSFYSVGNDLGGYRIVQLTANSWKYYSEIKKGFKWKWTSHKRELGPLVHNMVTLFDSSHKLSVCGFEGESFDFKDYFFSHIKGDRFIEVDNTKFFLCEAKRHFETCFVNEYRIFYIKNDFDIIGTEETYTSCDYIKDIGIFKVQTSLGWKFILYNNEASCFMDVPFLSTYKELDYQILHQYLFVKSDLRGEDFIDLKNNCNSHIWEKVRFSDTTKESLYLTSYEGIEKLVPIENLYQEYISQKDYLNKKYIQTRHIYNTEHDKTIKESYKKISMNINIDYCFKSRVKINENECLISTKECDYDILRPNSVIAWFDDVAHKAYLVRYQMHKTFKKIDELLLTDEEWDYISKISIKNFYSLGRKCTIDTFMSVMFDQFGSYQSVIRCNEVKLEKLKPTALIDTIKSTYTKLLHVAERDDVIEALYILFRKNIDKIQVHDDYINEMLRLIPSVKPEKIFNEGVYKEIISGLNADEASRFQLSYSYHITFNKEENIFDILNMVCNDCDTFSSKIKDKITTLIQEERIRRINDAKPIILDLLKYIVDSKEEGILSNKSCCKDENVKSLTKKEKSYEIILDDEKISLHLNEDIERSKISKVPRKYVRRSTAVYIFITADEADDFDRSNGIYLITGEGNDLRVDQTIGEVGSNSNYDLVHTNKKVFLFKIMKDGRCSLFDQIKYIRHEEKNDPDSRTDRKIILFTFMSLLRHHL